MFLILIRSRVRPERWRLSRRFATIPSRSMFHARRRRVLDVLAEPDAGVGIGQELHQHGAAPIPLNHKPYTGDKHSLRHVRLPNSHIAHIGSWFHVHPRIARS
jgi:hypothetical protein